MTGTVLQKVLVAASIVFILAGHCLTIAGAFSPAWQVVEIREFRAEHQHGLWWDCIRAEKHVVSVGDFYDETPLHCMYKFDNSAEMVIENTLNNIDEDGAAGESEHHKFWAWHKAILFFILSSEFLAFVSMCTGICAICFPPAAFAFVISLFIALMSSLIADGVFFLAANRVDNRFVQGMVGTYEQQIGYAFYLHIMGTLCWLVAFLLTITATYKIFSGRNDQSFSKENLFSWNMQRSSAQPLSVNELAFRGVPREEPLLEKPYLSGPSSGFGAGPTAYNSAPYRPSPQPSPYRPQPSALHSNYRETSA